MKTVNITRLENGEINETQDLIADEVSLKVILNDKKLAEFSCSGTYVNELIIGYLYYYGYINLPGDISSLSYDIEKETVQIELQNSPSSYMNGIVAPTREYNADNIFSLMEAFVSKSDKFLKTGAVHSAGIANDEGIIVSFDDLSRHNTLFMLLGYSLTQNVLLSDKILLVTCRLTKSIIDIILKANIRTIVTKAAPTNLAVETCKKNNIALAGFVRGNRMNIYNKSSLFL